jgi:hypothetical protein
MSLFHRTAQDLVANATRNNADDNSRLGIHYGTGIEKTIGHKFLIYKGDKEN